MRKWTLWIIIYKTYKLPSTLIARASEWLRLSTSYFQHFILHHVLIWSFCTNHFGQLNVWGKSLAQIKWETTLTLHNSISIMDKVKINEQNNSIATGPFNIHTEFETI